MGNLEKCLHVRVRFYFPKDETHRNERLDKARTVLAHSKTPISETSSSLPNGTEEVVLQAIIPYAIANLHHAFDSILNKGYEAGGCGAGIVDDLGEVEI